MDFDMEKRRDRKGFFIPPTGLLLFFTIILLTAGIREGRAYQYESLGSLAAGETFSFISPPFTPDLSSLPDLNFYNKSHGEEDMVVQSGIEEATPEYVILTTYIEDDIARPFIERQIELFTIKKRKTFEKWLERMGKYIEIIRTVLLEEDMPEDLVYLPLIESGYNTSAFSRARAVGPWQFIDSTARRYGLKIDYWRDERRDPVKSTRAAARYLKDLYSEFGTWSLALAAYNAGEGKIRKALRKTKADNYWGIARTRYLKTETRNYVSKFIAAGTIASAPEDFGFNEIDYHPPLRFEEVDIMLPASLTFIAECSDTSVPVIKELNPELKRWCTPPDLQTYTIRIPEGQKDVFLECFYNSTSKERMPKIPYFIKKGDTLYDLAIKYNIPQKELLALNKGINPRRLRPGSMIYLPPSDGTEEIHAYGGNVELISYTIKAGDTFYDIARKYKVPEKELYALNRDVDPKRLRPGTLIYLPYRN